jgi:hypothetical protein
VEEDDGYKQWLAFIDKWYPQGDKADVANAGAYTASKLLVRVLNQCGDELTRENLMRQAANIRDLALPMPTCTMSSTCGPIAGGSVRPPAT